MARGIPKESQGDEPTLHSQEPLCHKKKMYSLLICTKVHGRRKGQPAESWSRLLGSPWEELPPTRVSWREESSSTEEVHTFPPPPAPRGPHLKHRLKAAWGCLQGSDSLADSPFHRHVAISALQRTSSRPQFATEPCKKLRSTRTQSVFHHGWVLGQQVLSCPSSQGSKTLRFPLRNHPGSTFPSAQGRFLPAGKRFEGEHPPPLAQGLGHLLGVTPPRTRQARRLPTFRLVVAQRAGGAGTGVRTRAPRTARAAQGV